MKSVVELDVDCPRAKLAALFADPANIPKWMDELARIEPVRGKLGEPGSAYRMVPKKGNMVFVATVVARELPTQVRLSLDEPRVSVAITDKFLALPGKKTKLISEEIFAFKGIFNKLFGIFARPAIKRAHRRHMEALKRFAETRRS